MIKKNKGKMLISSLLILLPMVVGLLLWDRLPEEMVIHWGIDNAPDGWSGKGLVVFGMPVLLLALHWLCILLTAVDPKSKNQSKKVMALMFWICPVICLACLGTIYAQALGMEVDALTSASVLVGTIFLVIGNYLPKCKQNHIFGIKLPWTLKSRSNWNATHRFAGRVMVIGGVLFFGCVFLPKAVLPIVLLIVLPVMVILPMGYSYLYYKKHDK